MYAFICVLYFTATTATTPWVGDWGSNIKKRVVVEVATEKLIFVLCNLKYNIDVRK